MINCITFTIIILMNFSCAGCPYSFTGSSMPAHLKTIFISLFDDQSNFGEPGLRENLTRSITDKFINDNTLTVSEKNISNSVLTGVILRVNDKPVMVATGEKIDRKRIEITIKATYTDMVKKKKVWEKEFTNWGDYPSGGSGFSQRSTGIKTAIDKISEDILLQTVSGW
jgi:hypothetical protein